MAMSQTFHCDGPLCMEEEETPLDWLCTTILSVSDATTQLYVDQFNMKVFHNAACLAAYLESLE